MFSLVIFFNNRRKSYIDQLEHKMLSKSSEVLRHLKRSEPCLNTYQGNTYGRAQGAIVAPFQNSIPSNDIQGHHNSDERQRVIKKDEGNNNPEGYSLMQNKTQFKIDSPSTSTVSSLSLLSEKPIAIDEETVKQNSKVSQNHNKIEKAWINASIRSTSLISPEELHQQQPERKHVFSVSSGKKSSKGNDVANTKKNISESVDNKKHQKAGASGNMNNEHFDIQDWDSCKKIDEEKNTTHVKMKSSSLCNSLSLSQDCLPLRTNRSFTSTAGLSRGVQLKRTKLESTKFVDWNRPAFGRLGKGFSRSDDNVSDSEDEEWGDDPEELEEGISIFKNANDFDVLFDMGSPRDLKTLGKSDVNMISGASSDDINNSSKVDTNNTCPSIERVNSGSSVGSISKARLISGITRRIIEDSKTYDASLGIICGYETTIGKRSSNEDVHDIRLNQRIHLSLKHSENDDCTTTAVTPEKEEQNMNLVQLFTNAGLEKVASQCADRLTAVGLGSPARLASLSGSQLSRALDLAGIGGAHAERVQQACEENHTDPIENKAGSEGYKYGIHEDPSDDHANRMLHYSYFGVYDGG